MSRRSRARARAAAVARRRDDVQEAVSDVRDALGDELGPGVARNWALVVAGGAVGIAAAWWWYRLRSR